MHVYMTYESLCKFKLTGHLVTVRMWQMAFVVRWSRRLIQTDVRYAVPKSVTCLYFCSQ